VPVSRDLMELVQLLDEEGFGALAGELLTEISLGREIHRDELDTDDSLFTGSSAGKSESPEQFDDAPPPREPILESEQLSVAAEFLRLRLVEPIRRLAEAETIAGRLARETPNENEKERSAASVTPTRIKFVRPPDDDMPPLDRIEAPGRADTADALAAVLERLAGTQG
jgi:hypothetical protein